ncbi:MAG: putative domain and rane protein [Pseudomonadota bacterium]|jgi:diguanylate cyclase (GGDEF)-like protein
MTDQPLLIALVAVQFVVHALGWSMAAHVTGRWHDAEGQFAGFWLLLAAGLLLYVPAWASGSAPRNLGNVLIVVALAAQHRGMSLYWGRRPLDRAYFALSAITFALTAISLTLASGHGLRVAAVCLGAAVMLAATVHLVWKSGKPQMPRFSLVMVGGYGLLAAVLCARAVQALTVAPATKISIDAPGHLNVPFAILVLFIGGLINLAQVRLILGRVLQHLTAEARTDPLTGTANRRGLTRYLDEVHARSRDGDHPYVLMMVDIDHFKAINDQHGHDEGDRVITRIAQALRDGLRVGDFVARWGGEEFCVLMPRIRLAEARALAERLTLQVAASGHPRVTISVGIAEARAHSETAETVIKRADEAMYLAKQSGRNRVVEAVGAMPA